jgi:hypothetical protein
MGLSFSLITNKLCRPDTNITKRKWKVEMVMEVNYMKERLLLETPESRLISEA